MSYNKLGFTKGQTLKAEHLNHMEEGIANVSWSDLTDKPFGEVVETINSITWDGNFEGKDVVSMGGGYVSIKVSDAAITAADMIGGSYTLTLINSDIPDETFVIDESMITPVTDGLSIIGEQGHVVVVDKDEVDFNGIIFTKGIYFLFVDGVFYASNLTLSSSIEGLVTKKIDEKYLPTVGVTKFYAVQGGDGYLHTSVNDLEETRVHSRDIDTAVSRGTIVLYVLFDDGSLDSIVYPYCFSRGASGYWISAYCNGHNVEYQTSDFVGRPS